MADTTSTDWTTLIELDSRKRAALGRLAHHDRYLARVEPDGTLILTPATVMTKQEADRFLDPEIVALVEEKMRHPEKLNRNKKL